MKPLRYRDLARLPLRFRAGIPLLALGLGASEAGFVFVARQGLNGGGAPVLAWLSVLALLRFAFQDRIALLEVGAARAVTSGLRERLWAALRARAVPAYRPEIRRDLIRALDETSARIGEGFLARKRFVASALQGAILVPCLFLLSWKLAVAAVALAVPAWAALRWRSRSLRELERSESAGRAEGKGALEDFGNGLEALSGGSFDRALDGLETRLDRAREPEWAWRLAQARYPAILETAFFFALAGLVLIGASALESREGWLLFSGLLLLAYRPVREAARHYPVSLQGAQALRDAEALLRGWEDFPARAIPAAHPHEKFSLRAVDFAYAPGRPVFEDFSAEFDAGGITGVTGPNGSGKTTLLRLLSGAEVPARGGILWSPASIRAGIACLPQRAHPGADWPAWALELRARKPELWAELNGLLRLDRLGEKARHPESLSGGERQRMSLARVLASDAAFLLMDEPTTALPGDEREAILAGALKLWGRGALIVSHEPFLPQVCDTVFRLEESSLAAVAGPARTIP